MSRRDSKVVKANSVVEASYRLTAIEQRVILSAIAQIPKGKEIDDREFYQVTIDSLIQLGTNEKAVYKDLKEAVLKLGERWINIDIDGTVTKLRWIQALQYSDSNPSVVGIKFTHDLVPYISNLKQQFTKYNLKDIRGMNSSYAIRIYELLAQYRSLGKREITIADLRAMLALDDEYKLFADFKRNVIDIAIKQINQYSPILVEASYKKKGRAVNSVVFVFNDKAKAIDTSTTDTETMDLFTGLNGKQVQLFAMKLSEYQPFYDVFEPLYGEDMQPYRARIAEQLMNPDIQLEWIEHLKAVGYGA